MISASVVRYLEDLSLLLILVALGRLVFVRLYRVYPFFFLSLCAPAIIQAVTVVYGSNSRYLFYCWIVLEPLRNVLFILVVWELFSVIFRNYAGLRSLSRWVMGAAAAIAPIGLLLSLATQGSVYAQYSKFVALVVRFERGIAMGLVVFIIIMLYFISRYPIKLPRNSVVLSMTISIFFLGDAAILLASSFLPKATGRSIVNSVLAVLEIGCCLAWATLLSEAGEFQETRVRRDISPEHEKALIGELEAMNQLLVRAGRSLSQTSGR